MKKAVLVLMAVLFLAATGFAMDHGAMKMSMKGKQVTMTGFMSCTFCSMGSGKQCTSKDCCVECVKAGDPVTLHGDKGMLYILLTNEQGKALMTPERIELLGGKVKVKGIMVKRGGLQAIFVESMEKAEQ